MQTQCVKGLDEVGIVKETGTTTPEAVAIQHTNGVLDIHKSCLQLAEEKVLLAVQTYDLVSILTYMLRYFLCDVHLFVSHRVAILFKCIDLRGAHENLSSGNSALECHETPIV